jgi:hypothetical protein
MPKQKLAQLRIKAPGRTDVGVDLAHHPKLSTTSTAALRTTMAGWAVFSTGLVVYVFTRWLT